MRCRRPSPASRRSRPRFSAAMRDTSASARPRTSASSTRTRYWRVEPSALKSQGKNTPFVGLEVARQGAHDDRRGRRPRGRRPRPVTWERGRSMSIPEIPDPSARQDNIVPVRHQVTATERAARTSHHGAVLWFTGLAGFRQVDARDGARAAPVRSLLAGLHARRRQRPPRLERGSGLFAARPRGEHPARRRGGRALRRRGRRSASSRSSRRTGPTGRARARRPASAVSSRCT